MQEVAAALGKRLHAEDGTRVAIDFIQQYLQANRNPGVECVYLPDDTVVACPQCKEEFTFFFRRHHCLSCGGVFCGNCVLQRPLLNYSESVLVCFGCRDLRGLQKQPVRAGILSPDDE
jgi:hypothetical protein